jgi:hypothetical protein
MTPRPKGLAAISTPRNVLNTRITNCLTIKLPHANSAETPSWREAPGKTALNVGELAQSHSRLPFCATEGSTLTTERSGQKLGIAHFVKLLCGARQP